MTSKIFRPSLFLVALAVLVSVGQLTSANPIPDDETISQKFDSFVERFKNTLSANYDDAKQNLTTTEIVLISVGAVLILLFLSCCILACLCECVKEILCCICCCGRNS